MLYNLKVGLEVIGIEFRRQSCAKLIGLLTCKAKQIVRLIVKEKIFKFTLKYMLLKSGEFF